MTYLTISPTEDLYTSNFNGLLAFQTFLNSSATNQPWATPVLKHAYILALQCQTLKALSSTAKQVATLCTPLLFVFDARTRRAKCLGAGWRGSGPSPTKPQFLWFRGSSISNTVLRSSSCRIVRCVFHWGQQPRQWSRHVLYRRHGQASTYAFCAPS